MTFRESTQFRSARTLLQAYGRGVRGMRFGHMAEEILGVRVADGRHHFTHWWKSGYFIATPHLDPSPSSRPTLFSQRENIVEKPITNIENIVNRKLNRGKRLYSRQYRVMVHLNLQPQSNPWRRINTCIHWLSVFISLIIYVDTTRYQRGIFAWRINV